MSMDMYNIDGHNLDTLSEFFSVLEPYPFNTLIAWALRFCFRNPYEGMIVVDKDGLIQFMDRSTERFFGLQSGKARGKNVGRTIPDADLPLVLSSGEPLIGRVREISGRRYVGSSYPLKKHGEMIGAVSRVVFHPLEEIERMNVEMKDLKKEIYYFKEKEKQQYNSAYTFDNILGTSRLIKDAIATAKRVSMLDTDVLIVGESGTGKELFAHSIHSYAYSEKPFVKVNCPAIPFDLAESQLFGYEKGAFTGATSSGMMGIFEMANNGVVFFDEISALPLLIQAKLLRVLQEREVQRIGSTKSKKINFRFIAAANVDLYELVEQGKFRPDLYYRIASPALNIPALRHRKEDITLYLQTFLENINRSFKTKIKRFSQEAMDILVKYDWPGNVRQLIHVLEQIAINVWNAEEIRAEDLPKEVLSLGRGSVANNSTLDISWGTNDKEKDSIINALRETGGNKKRAALLLNMPRSTFYNKINRYAIKQHIEKRS
jgi:transcriptional regulator with PAS, ATPase and Fis domain